jgi:hypothetical protein
VKWILLKALPLHVEFRAMGKNSKKRAIIQHLIVLLLILVATPASAWWNCDWDNRFAANIAPPGGTPVGSYQVRMDLNATNVPAQFNWSLQGDDLRVVDENDQTELSFFIEQWNAPGQTAVIWVLVPGIPGGGRTVYLYFGAPAGTPSASTPMTFTSPGFRFHTRNTAANPNSRATAEAAFAAAPVSTPGYGCAILSSYTNVNNTGTFGPPNRNSNIGLYAEAFFEVTPAEAGVWQFRYGADFGRGGGLYVDDVALDEKWNADLWWNYNWNNSAETLSGAINLGAGYHSIRIIGFEGCCDGGLTVQFMRPGGAFQAMSLANISMASRACPVAAEPNVTFGSVEVSTCPVITVTLNAQTLSDPENGTVNPKAIPGAIITNIVTVSNSGADAADANSFFISQAVPSNAALRVSDFDGSTAGPVQFSDGSPASGLTYTFLGLGNAGDDVGFSDDNGSSYLYAPVPGADGSDPAVTNIRINPKGIFNGSSGGGDPGAQFAFRTILK